MALPVILPLHSEFGSVIIVSSIICLLMILTGFFVAYRVRMQIFKQDFMEDGFQEQHLEATGDNIYPKGYPDMGDGRYAERLSYFDWLKFNRAQRTHFNFVEEIAPLIFMLIIAGFVFPMEAAVVGIVYFMGRALFTVFYATPQGSDHLMRVTGSVLCLGSLTAAFILDIVGAVFVFLDKP